MIIAATAELAGLTVLHLDKDFEIIADVTGQPVERLCHRLILGPGWSLWLVGGNRALATVLSGASAYGAGVNIGLGAARLQLAARAAGISPLPEDDEVPELAG